MNPVHAKQTKKVRPRGNKVRQVYTGTPQNQKIPVKRNILKTNKPRIATNF